MLTETEAHRNPLSELQVMQLLHPDAKESLQEAAQKDPGLPRTSPTWSTWLRSLPEHFSTKHGPRPLPDAADIVIIGSGFSGASTAYHLLCELQYPGKVVMIEARDACSGATGRNGGHMTAPNYRDFLMDVERYAHRMAAEDGRVEPTEADREIAVRMTVETRRFDDEGVKANIAFAKEHNIDCGYRQGENVQVYDTPEVYAIGQKHFQAAQKAGLTGARWLSKEEMKRVLGTTEYAAADAVPGAHMFPAKFVWYLLDQAIASGLELHTHTPVIDVNNGVVTTKDGSVVTAKHVVFATNAWTSHLVPELRGHIIPLRDQVITVPRTDSATDPVLPSGGLWMSNGSEYAIELSNGGRLIMGGFYEESGRHQAGNANDAELIPGVSTDLREALVSVPPLQKFPYDKPASPEIHEWTGIIAVSNDSAPYVGKLERLSSDKYSAWIVAGHNGEGMPRCFLFGKYIAQKLAQSFGMHVADPIAIPRAMKPNPHRVSNLDYFAWNLE